jgi:coenzyme F420-dependent glucose-6-phosphate dehydrogenase
MTEVVPCGPDADRYREAIKEYEEAGYDHVFVHQIGPDQEAFFSFFESEILARV